MIHYKSAIPTVDEYRRTIARSRRKGAAAVSTVDDWELEEMYQAKRGRDRVKFNIIDKGGWLLGRTYRGSAAHQKHVDNAMIAAQEIDNALSAIDDGVPYRPIPKGRSKRRLTDRESILGRMLKGRDLIASDTVVDDLDLARFIFTKPERTHTKLGDREYKRLSKKYLRELA